MVKWGGAVVSVVLLVVWVGSGWWYLGRMSSARVYFVASCGQLRICSYVYSDFRSPSLGTNVGRTKMPFGWWFRYQQDASGQYLYIPLWFLAVVSGSVTTNAWRLDTLARRRVRAGLCPKCNYDRTGLAPGAVCPECGAAAIVPAALPSKGI